MVNSTLFLIQLLTIKPMKSNLKRIQNDIAFCIDELNLEDEMIWELLRICEDIGVSCEYFMNEFVCTEDNSDPVHDPEYLSIREVNRIYYSD